MSIIYKDLLPDDISIQDFKSHKEWNIHHLSTGSLFRQYIYKKHSSGSLPSFGAYYSGSQFFESNLEGQLGNTYPDNSGNPTYARLIYSNLSTTFYMTGSTTPNEPAKASQNALEYHPERDVSNFTHPSEDNYFTGSVWSLPTNIIGEGIKPGSISISHSNAGISLTDDGKGNLVNSSNAIYGNIFYKSGIFVFPAYSSYNTFGKITENAGWRQLSFKSTLTMTEHEYYCTIQDGEFNQSTNPTILSGSNNGVAAGAEGTGSYVLRNIATSSAWQPYITTVGLYNDRGDLCAVGKLAKPLKGSDKYDTSIVVRFDA